MYEPIHFHIDASSDQSAFRDAATSIKPQVEGTTFMGLRFVKTMVELGKAEETSERKGVKRGAFRTHFIEEFGGKDVA